MDKLDELDYEIQAVDTFNKMIDQEIFWHLSHVNEVSNTNDFNLGFLVGMNQIKNIMISFQERLRTEKLELSDGDE